MLPSPFNGREHRGSEDGLTCPRPPVSDWQSRDSHSPESSLSPQLRPTPSTGLQLQGYFNLSCHSSQTTGPVSQSCGWGRKGISGSPGWKSCSSGWDPCTKGRGPARGLGQRLPCVSHQPSPQGLGTVIEGFSDSASSVPSV